MAILIDPPLWPAHGTLWSHLVSDRDYDELHEFAARVPVPRRGFDLDHYDLPESLYERAVALGARPVGSRDVVHRLRDSGLRVRGVDRDAERPIRRRQYLTAEWAALAERAGVGRSASPTTGAATDAALADKWHRLGGELIGRWNEPHRRYHDERHLEDVLLSLDQLAVRGERIAPAALLAAWFHDAVYAGTGTDETDSARLAVAALAAFDLTPALVRQVGDFIVATAPAAELPSVDPMLAHLLDADLSIFGAGRSATSATRPPCARSTRMCPRTGSGRAGPRSCAGISRIPRSTAPRRPGSCGRIAPERTSNARSPRSRRRRRHWGRCRRTRGVCPNRHEPDRGEIPSPIRRRSGRLAACSPPVLRPRSSPASRSSCCPSSRWRSRASRPAG
ncbi:DUF4031 domain-containing protein [Leucobacter soli]|uniref:DUF4031 domain-containing protein n=2 Tax=Leucobacter soli TaxID=2812850 RepID=UPI0036108E3F